MTYILGIDIGIASVGFSGVVADKNKVVFSGVHIFEAAETPKDGSSLATPRREKRGQRRVIDRRRKRKLAIKRLLSSHGLHDISLIHKNEIKGEPIAPSVWDLRNEALTRILTDTELARVLFHIAKRRGFQSNRKGAQSNDTEGKKALNGALELQEAMVHSGLLTIGSYLSTLPKKRNGDGNYERFVTRDLLREEVNYIFKSQQKLGNDKATSDLLLAYAGNGKDKDRNTIKGDGIAFYQRPLQSSMHLIGECTLEKGEKRAPKLSYSAELFVLWGKINNTRIKDKRSNERSLTQDEKNRLADLADKNKGGVKYKQVRKELNLSDDERFNISYRKIKTQDNSWDDIKKTSEESYFFKLTGYHATKKAMDTGSSLDWQSWIGKDRDNLDDIARILSFYEDKTEVDNMLSEYKLSKDQKDKLCAITSFSKSVDLSLKAIRNILPYMQKGMRYDEACKEAGYHHSKRENKGLRLVPPFEDIRNPVVNRALAQTRKIINACIRKYGMPDNIIVEMAREVGKNFKDRKDIERNQKKNESYRNEAKSHMAEILGIIEDNVSGEDIIKYRLWMEQNCFCPYSGVYIEPKDLRDNVATQIDHIIPYSRSWNNSYMNKVLCFTDENQMKGNDTPVDFFKRTGRDIAMLEESAKRLPPKKSENLLMENYDERKTKEWKSRALNDTRYIAKLLKNHLEENLDLGKGQRVQTRNGALTAYLRGMWGFSKKNRNNDRHHALDAIVLASSTQSMVQRLSNWNKYEARKKNPDKRPFPPKPWEDFRQDAIDSVNSIFVSRMPVRKVTGSAHEETIRSIRKSDGKIIQRTKLKSLSLKMLEDMVDKNRNIKLYNILKERLEKYDGKADKAFAEPIYMPVNDPSKTAPRINSIRIETNKKHALSINGGSAPNGDMVRVDVFQRDGKYFLVPIYVHHFVKNKLPNKAILAFKDEKDWIEMKEDEFIFSLYKNDLVLIKNKKEKFFGYYNGTHRGTAGIHIRTHDSDPDFGKNGIKENMGVKTLLSFEKYSVDYFGNKTLVKKEVRLGVAQCNDKQSSKAIAS